MKKKLYWNVSIHPQRKKKSDSFKKRDNTNIFLVDKNNFIIPVVTKMNIKYLDLVLKI